MDMTAHFRISRRKMKVNWSGRGAVEKEIGSGGAARRGSGSVRLTQGDGMN